MNEDAADALLKDLEEPPDYAVIVLVADELGPLPETIRSRCQLVPFRRLSRRRVEEHVAAATARSRAGARAARRAGRRRPPRPGRAAARPRGGRAARRADRARALRLPRRALRRRATRPGRSSGVARAARAPARPPRRRGGRGGDRRASSSSGRSASRAAPSARRSLEALDLLAGWYRDLARRRRRAPERRR